MVITEGLGGDATFQEVEGVGSGVRPRAALEIGLKVDADAPPRSLLSDLKRGLVNLDDPAVTLELLRRNAVVGLTGFFGATKTEVAAASASCEISG